MFEAPDPVKNLLDEEHLEMLSYLEWGEAMLVVNVLTDAKAISDPENEPHPPVLLEFVRDFLRVKSSQNGYRSGQITKALIGAQDKKSDPDAVVDMPNPKEGDKGDEGGSVGGGLFDGLSLRKGGE